jgi:hypothetical protein
MTGSPTELPKLVGRLPRPLGLAHESSGHKSQAPRCSTIVLPCLGRHWAADSRCRSVSRGQQWTVAPQVTVHGSGSRG